MKRAVSLIRPQLVYRREAFHAGLQAAGYKLESYLAEIRPHDVLVIWNRYGEYDAHAKRFEKAGARVVVAENPYLREGKWLALAKSHHSGAGSWNVGGPERWDALGIELQPWRSEGKEVLILGQRAIGELGIAAPRGWAETIQKQLGGRVRSHPGTSAPAVALEDDLRKAHAVVTWNSSAALRALILGVPVFCAFPQWIGASAATPIDEFPRPRDVDRLAMFRRLIWAQWTIEEIKSGEAFRCLL